MVGAGHEKDRAAARHHRRLSGEQSLFAHQQARRAGTTEELVAGDEHGVFGDKGLAMAIENESQPSIKSNRIEVKSWT